MPVAFGTGPTILSEPFTYSDGSLASTSAWDSPFIVGNGDLQISTNYVTQDTDGSFLDAYTTASYGDGDYIINVKTKPADGRRFFFHIAAQNPGTSGCDSWCVDYQSQAGVADRWRLRQVIDGVLQTAIIDTNLEGVNGMDVGIRLNGTTISMWTDAASLGTLAQLGTDQTITAPGAGRIVLESNGIDCVVDDLLHTALEDTLVLSGTFTTTVSFSGNAELDGVGLGATLHSDMDFTGNIEVVPFELSGSITSTMSFSGNITGTSPAAPSTPSPTRPPGAVWAAIRRQIRRKYR